MQKEMKQRTTGKINETQIYFLKKKKINKAFTIWTKKERRLKLLKLEMKAGTLLPIVQEFF